MKLSDRSQSRDNNFNLIRMVAACSVLVSHSFALTGSGEDPVKRLIGMVTLGDLAVDLFFVASGFLVTASLLKRQNGVDFVWARFLRIYPAYWLMLLMMAFVLGPLFTTLPPSDYFAQSSIYVRLAKAATVFIHTASTLPGVFTTNPLPNAVNGSLWTMPYEVRMYAILAVTWLLLRWRSDRIRALQRAVIVYALLAAGYLLAEEFALIDQSPRRHQLARFIFMFFSGATFYVLRARIRLHGALFWPLLLLLLLSVEHRHLFFVLYHGSIAYLLLYLAYVPSGLVRGYNRVGDYSYGFYIYAFPVQQAVVALISDVSVLEMVLIAVPVVLLLSALSWHLLEKRVLTLKERYVQRTRAWLGAAPAE